MITFTKVPVSRNISGGHSVRDLIKRRRRRQKECDFKLGGGDWSLKQCHLVNQSKKGKNAKADNFFLRPYVAIPKKLTILGKTDFRNHSVFGEKLGNNDRECLDELFVMYSRPLNAKKY